jgi:hypothetical protein
MLPYELHDLLGEDTQRPSEAFQRPTLNFASNSQSDYSPTLMGFETERSAAGVG